MFAGENQFDLEISAAIRRWSAEYGVAIPTWLVKAIIARESSFRLSPPLSPEPTTGDASHGLMRVREATARDLGFTGPFTRLHAPALGILYGVKYLAQQLRRYGGNTTLAAAAYNAGPGRVKAGRPLPNQTYVDRVLGFVRYFQQTATAAAPAAALLAAVALGYIVLARRRRAA